MINDQFISTKLGDVGVESSINPHSNIDLNFIDTEMDSLDLEFMPRSRVISPKAASPSFIISSKSCKSVYEEIREFANVITELYPKTIKSPYSFSDVKILKDESSVVAVTLEGVFIMLNLFNSSFVETVLCDKPLAAVLICKNDTLGIAKERDRPVIYLVTIHNMVIKKVIDLCSSNIGGIGRLSLSPDQNYLYARLWKGDIIRWNLNTLTSYTTMHYDRNIICMNISPDNLIVTGSIDKKLSLFSLEFELLLEKSFKFIIDAYINFSSSGDLIILGMSDSIKIINKDTLSLINDIYTGCLCYSSMLSVDEKYVISGLETGELGFFNRYTNNHLKISIHKSSILSISASKDQSIIYTFGTDSVLSFVRFPTLSLFKNAEEIDFPFNGVIMTSKSGDSEESKCMRLARRTESENAFKPLCMAHSEKEDIIIVGGESFNITVWDRISMRKYGELMGHTGFIYSLASLNDYIVASASADKKVILWNFRKLKKIAVLSGHMAAVSAVVKIDSCRLASGSWDRTVRIWVWEIETMVFCIKDLPERVVALCTPKYNKLFIGMKNAIHCWDLQQYCLMFDKDTEKEVSCFRIYEQGFGKDKRIYIGLGMEEGSLWIENPFLCKNIEVWGKSETGTYQFYEYIRSLLMGHAPKHNPQMDKFIVFPYRLNALHFYAYFDLPQHLFSAISNSAPLLNSVCYSNPLTISIEMNHKSCIEAIILAIWEQQSQNPYLLSILSVHTLNNLHRFDTSVLSKIYKLLMITSCDRTKIQGNKIRLPQIRASLLPNIHMKEWKNDEKHIQTYKMVRFSQSAVTLYLSPGSERSIKYLFSLSKCKDKKVFKTEFVKAFISYKWGRLKWAIYSELFIFICYYFCVLYCLLLDKGSTKARFFAFFIGSVLSCVEIFFSTSILNYWSLLCILKLIFICIWYFFKVQNQIFLSVFLILSAMYGIKYLDLLESTRKILEYLWVILGEAIRIIVVCFYVIIGVSAIYTIIGVKFVEFDQRSVEDEVKDGFLLIAGLLFMTGVTLVKDKHWESIEVYWILLILKIELIMAWKRSDKTREYLQVCDEVKPKGKKDLKRVKKTFKEFKKEEDEVLRKYKDWKEHVFMIIKDTNNTVLEIKKQMKRDKRRNTQTF